MRRAILIPTFIIGGFILWFVIYFATQRILKIERKDSIEITNSIIGALAFAGVIITVSMQQKELSLQVQELKETKAEFKEQNKTLKKQRFENTFFSMLNVHNSITEKIYIYQDNKEHRSRDAFYLFYNEFRGQFLNAYREKGTPVITQESIDDHRRLVLHTFGEVYRKYEQYFSHYFRNLITLIQLVKNSDLMEDADRKQYYSIIRSQLNSYEIVTHFYNFNAGFASQYKTDFDLLELGAIMNSSLLPIVQHSFIYDPPHVVEAALATRSIN